MRLARLSPAAALLLVFGGSELSAGSLPSTFTVRQSADWAPIELPAEVTPGSALDFSGWTEAPAGQHGRVMATPDGHFAFANAPETPVRFWGANVNFDVNFISKPEAEKLARRLRAMGYNAVRIHHYDVLLSGGWDSKKYEIDPAMQDRLDYLFHCMKQQGLYVSTDLFTIRRIHSPEVAQYDGKNLAVVKALIPVLPAAMEDWKRFARDLLQHRNPYTEMTWAEDPALFSICPVNEDTLWAALDANPKVRALYDEKFEKWLAAKTGRKQEEEERAAAFNEFLAETQIAADAAMRGYLRNELNCDALITGNNWKYYIAQTPIRSKLEYVDNHAYWDHPDFSGKPWSYPFSHSQRSAIRDRAEVPRRLFLTRIEGLPFAVTEFNYVYPNQYRSEGGALFGAYAALQDWDALFRFAWAHDAKEVTSRQPAQGFDISVDPINLLSEHIIGMFWRRGDMPAFEEKAVYTVNRKEAFAAGESGREPPRFPDNATLLGLTKRVASRYEPDGKAANLEFHDQKPQTRYEASTGDAHVILETAGDFLAESKFSKAITVQDKSLDEQFVRDVKGGPATIFAGALDRKPLAQSDRILVLHLTDCLSDGVTFGEKGMNSILDKGGLPLLVRRGSATVCIANDPDTRRIQVHALDLSGNRVAEIPFSLEREGTRIQFEVSTIGGKGDPTLAYELIRTAQPEAIPAEE